VTGQRQRAQNQSQFAKKGPSMPLCKTVDLETFARSEKGGTPLREGERDGLGCFLNANGRESGGYKNFEPYGEKGNDRPAL